MSAAPILVHDVPEVAENSGTQPRVETEAKWVAVVWACAMICLGTAACFLLMNSTCCSP